MVLLLYMELVDIIRINQFYFRNFRQFLPVFSVSGVKFCQFFHFKCTLFGVTYIELFQFNSRILSEFEHSLLQKLQQMESATEKINSIMDQIKNTERPNFTQAQLAIEIVLSEARTNILQELVLLMSAKFQNPPLPQLKY
jgi:hypothetical protein